MNNSFLSVKKLLLGAAMGLSFLSAFSQMAKVQVIHNSPDAPNVDVLINGSTVAGLTNVPYKAASGFLEVPVTPPTTVQIAVAGTSTIVSTDEVTLVAGTSYRAIASGLVGSTVSGEAFEVIYYEANVTTTTGETGLDIYHGSPNAPTVGVVARGVATLVSAFSFKDAEFVSVPSNTYTVDIRAGNSVGATVASYSAPLGGFSGQNIAVIATGTFPGTFGLLAVTDAGGVVELPAPSPALVQVIHNSPGAPNVDVLINGSTVAGLTNVPFRAASGFLNVPLFPYPTTVQIAVAGTSTVVSTDILTNLMQNTAYRAIATGVVGSTVSGQEFDVTYFGATTTTVAGQTGLDIYHSSPDAPAVGVVARGVATLVSAFSFKDDEFVRVPSDSYSIDVKAGNAVGANVASFTAPLAGFAGQNIAVLASGLLSGTPSFGLIAVAANGTVVVLPTTTGPMVPPAPAKVQVIHNSPGAPAVDVWVNGMTVLGGVMFRQASGFLDVPVSTPTTVQIAVTGSNPYNIVSTDVLTLSSGVSYRAIATGVVGSTVSGQEFDVTYFGATTTTVAGQTGLDIYHSSPDAPAVGVVARGVATLVSTFSFKDDEFVSVPSDSYTIDIKAGNAVGANVASFTAPLAGFAGQNIAVLASGLLSGTPSFGLIAVAANGTVVVLPTTTGPVVTPPAAMTAKVQVIHNSPGAPAVDVWVNGMTVLGGVMFRQASSFLSVDVAMPTTVQIAVSGSNPYTIVSTDVLTLASGMSYRAIATGVVGSTVSGQEFDVTYFAATTTTTAGNAGLEIIHSSPDAPAVGVVARGVTTLVGSFSFKAEPVFVSVPSGEYIVDINAGSATGATVASFTAPLAGFGGQNIAVLASGLLSGTPSFGLIAVAADGTVILLPTAAGVNALADAKTSDALLYPNPSTGTVYLSSSASVQTFTVSDALGKIVFEQYNVPAGAAPIDLSSLNKGLYFVSLKDVNGVYKLSKLIVE